MHTSTCLPGSKDLGFNRGHSRDGSMDAPFDLSPLQGVQAPQRRARARKARIPDRHGVLLLARCWRRGYPPQADLKTMTTSFLWGGGGGVWGGCAKEESVIRLVRHISVKCPYP